MNGKQHGYIDLGPEWMWVVAGWLMAIGALSILGAICFGAWWLISHLVFV
jgi:hypothetical protein